jgi:hypothetical protein
LHEVIAPEHAQKVFSTYYSTERAVQPLMIIGAAQVVVIVAFAIRFLHFWTSSAMLVM